MKMKQIITFLILSTLLIFMACEVKVPNHPELNITVNQLVLSKVVFVGSSFTAGFQSTGLVKDFQENSFPYQIAKQMGKTEFQQPLIADPGISSTPGFGVLDFNPATGAIEPRGTYTDPTALLSNATLARPYDNLGIPGATLHDVMNSYNSVLANGNSFFDIVLRNLPDPNFGNMTQLQQAHALNPTLIILWIGSNDVLGAALDGGNTSLITDQTEFQSDFSALLTELGKIRGGKIGIIVANIPNVTDIPYVNILDGLVYKNITIPSLGTFSLPVVFDATFQPVDFDPNPANEIYIPLLTEEGIIGGGASPVKHLLLPFLSEYQSSGLGVPDSAAIATMLIGFGYPPATAAGLAQQAVQGMIAAGLIPSGIPIPGDLSITTTEESELINAVDGFNLSIENIAGNSIPVVDANSMLNTLNTSGLDGYSGKFVLIDPANTAFSLDGVHPNNGGYAIIANAFIDKINLVLNLNVPKINTALYKRQYLDNPITTISLEAANQAKALFVQKKR